MKNHGRIGLRISWLATSGPNEGDQSDHRLRFTIGSDLCVLSVHIFSNLAVGHGNPW